MRRFCFPILTAILTFTITAPVFASSIAAPSGVSGGVTYAPRSSCFLSRSDSGRITSATTIRIGRPPGVSNGNLAGFALYRSWASPHWLQVEGQGDASGCRGPWNSSADGSHASYRGFAAPPGGQYYFALLYVPALSAIFAGSAYPLLYAELSVRPVSLPVAAGGNIDLWSCGVGASGTCTSRYFRSRGAVASAPHPTASNGFHRNCVTYRGSMWSITEKVATLQGQWWTDLERDYGNNYPPTTGGSVPGITGSQFQAAQADMVAINQQLDDQAAQTGLEWDVVRLDIKYGINPKSNKGPFNWAAERVYGSAYFLELAAYEEWKQAGSGLNDYHLAQQFLSNSWDALKQLPCR